MAQAENHDLARWQERATEHPAARCAVTSRNLYPPRVDDWPAVSNNDHSGGSPKHALHCWGWEESELPREWVANFNKHVHGVSTMSRYVSKVLIDNGVTVPTTVAGIGVDHWQRIAPDASFQLPDGAKGFNFLHVSSCFPRKGVDVLLKAFGVAFTAADDVALIIKTFANPHNKVHEWLDQARADTANYPRVIIIEQDLSDAEVKALVERSDALVAPSRGEGFGLPMAEAMLSGKAIITTAYGGQTDFCTDDTAWLIDYDFARAKTHFELPNSVWAEPRLESLVAQLKAVHSSSEAERCARAVKGKALLLEQFTWRAAAQRTQALVEPPLPASKCADQQGSGDSIAWVSTWQTRCGIAGYSKFLVDAAPEPIHVYAAHRTALEEADASLIDADTANVTRCWQNGGDDDLSALAKAIDAGGHAKVVIQFNYGFFDFPALASLIESLKAAGKIVAVMFHATSDPAALPQRKLADLAPTLARCDRLLVHAPADLNRLKALGLVDNTAIIAHGIRDWPGANAAQQRVLERAEARAAAKAKEGAPSADCEAEQLTASVSESASSQLPTFELMSYGFFLPHKGLPELVQAVELLRDTGKVHEGELRLTLMNAEYPAQVSRDAISAMRDYLREKQLEGWVALDTGFYDEDTCLERLARADLVVFPYQVTGESSSAAVRHALATGVPVAVTPLAIFDDVAPGVLKLPGSDAKSIANGLIELSARDSHGIKCSAHASNDWRQDVRHEAVARRLCQMLRRLGV